jgi:hypothetical protein
MTSLYICSILVGVVLGMRFKVLILIPLMGVACIAAMAALALGRNWHYSIGLALATVLACMQVGYLFGSAMRFILAAGRVHRPSPINTRAVGLVRSSKSD